MSPFTSSCHMCSHAPSLFAHHCYVEVSQLYGRWYGPPEWMQHAVINQVLVLKDSIWLSALHELKRIRADNRRRRRRKTSNRQGFSIILIQIYVYSNFGSIGEAWQMPLVIFLPPPIDSVSRGSVLAGPLNSEHAPFSYHRELITGML